MILKHLLKDFGYEIVQGNDCIEVKDIVYDSRKASQDTVFVCIKGLEVDGHDYVGDAINRGCQAIIVATKGLMIDDEDINVIYCENTREALAHMSGAYFSYPSKELITIGITGTKGKTTTAYMLKEILKASGYHVGIIGTIGVQIEEEVIDIKNTTPESYVIQKYMREMVEKGCQVVIMEVSSQGLMHDRVAGILFDYGVLTNIGIDHIGKNEHSDFKHYIECKSLLFKQCKIGVVNNRSIALDELLENATCKVTYFGVQGNAKIYDEDVGLKMSKENLGIIFNVKGNRSLAIELRMMGHFNVENALAAITVADALGVSDEGIIKGLEMVDVRGRVEVLPIQKEFTVLVDYAHNAVALENLLIALREYRPKRLICLFGCGGNRAKGRRIGMGKVSAKFCDLTIITSDNPRFEEPMAIINDILEGVIEENGEYLVIPDRKKAMAYIMENGQKGDLIVVAGKGHEDYQEVKGVKYALDDRKYLLSLV